MPAPSSSHALRGRIGAYALLAKTPDRATITAAARKAFLDRFDRDAAEQHPEVTEAQRAQMADAARKAYFARLAQLSADKRRKAREAVQAAEAAEAELSALAEDGDAEVAR